MLSDACIVLTFAPPPMRQGAIAAAWRFITDPAIGLGLPIERLRVSVLEGDTATAAIWAKVCVCTMFRMAEVDRSHQNQLMIPTTTRFDGQTIAVENVVHGSNQPFVFFENTNPI
jgi:hypothetical protein